MGYRIVCYGDSNTYGFDPRSYIGEPYPKEVRWTGLLEQAGWEVANEGENGRAIPRLEWEMESACEILRRSVPDALAIMLGTNDLLQRPGLAAEACAERMEAFLAVLLQKAPATLKILLVSPPPMKPGPWVTDSGVFRESLRLSECYRALAEKMGVSFADTALWNIELAFDGVHFSERGHQAFGKQMDKALRALFGIENSH